jgi:hypothetical protein
VVFLFATFLWLFFCHSLKKPLLTH